MKRILRTLLGLASAIVAPSSCAACDAEVPYGTAFCPPCVATLVREESSGPDHFAAFIYGGAIMDAVRRFKFDDRPDLAAPLAAGLARFVPHLREVDLVVPVPLHPRRLVERGYNQAALLGRHIARMVDAPFAPTALARHRETSRQTDLSREERKENIARAFVASPAVSGRTVLLVDDVATTGATLDACSAALSTAGALRVLSSVVARTPREGGG